MSSNYSARECPIEALRSNSKPAVVDSLFVTGILDIALTFSYCECMVINLCESCKHVRLIANHRGSRFYLCRRSASDPSFPKFPRLPVLSCSGYEQELAAPEGECGADEDYGEPIDTIE